MNGNQNGPQPDLAKSVGTIFVWLVIIVVAVAAINWLFPGIFDSLSGRAARREKVVKPVNSYVDANNACVSTLNELGDNWAKYKKEEKQAKLGSARAIIGCLDPFSPIGVEPALASAISDFKTAELVYIDFLGEHLEDVDQEAAKTQMDRVDSAKTRIEAEINRIAGEIGGIERKRR